MASRTRNTSAGLSSARRIFLSAFAIALLSRQREVKRRPFSGIGFDPNAPAIQSDDVVAQRQTEACSCIFLLPMKPLEQAENLILVFPLDTHSVIFDRENPL